MSQYCGYHTRLTAAATPRAKLTDVSRVHADKEVDKDVLLLGRDVLEEDLLDGLTVWEIGADWDEELQGLRVDIADVDTTLMGEEDVVAFTDGVDADVELGVGGVGQERLDDLWWQRSAQSTAGSQCDKRSVSITDLRTCSDARSCLRR